MPRCVAVEAATPWFPRQSAPVVRSADTSTSLKMAGPEDTDVFDRVRSEQLKANKLEAERVARRTKRDELVQQIEALDREEEEAAEERKHGEALLKELLDGILIESYPKVRIVWQCLLPRRNADDDESAPGETRPPAVPGAPHDANEQGARTARLKQRDTIPPASRGPQPASPLDDPLRDETTSSLSDAPNTPASNPPRKRRQDDGFPPQKAKRPRGLGGSDHASGSIWMCLDRGTWFAVVVLPDQDQDFASFPIKLETSLASVIKFKGRGPRRLVLYLDDDLPPGRGFISWVSAKDLTPLHEFGDGSESVRGYNVAKNLKGKLG